jgi:hypothetical protein
MLDSRTRPLVLALACSLSLSRCGWAQEGLSWRRTQLTGLPFSAELPSGGEVKYVKDNYNETKTAWWHLLTLGKWQEGHGWEEAVRFEYCAEPGRGSGFHNATFQTFENRKYLGKEWGKPETKSWNGYTVHEIGMEDVHYETHRPTFHVYYIVEMGVDRYFTLQLWCYKENLSLYAPIYSRIRDSLAPAGAPRGRGKSKH